MLTSVLAGAGDLAEAERVGAAGLARARDAGDLWNQAQLLPRIGSHLGRIRDKTGCRRRADLTRLALTTGLV